IPDRFVAFLELGERVEGGRGRFLVTGDERFPRLVGDPAFAIGTEGRAEPVEDRLELTRAGLESHSGAFQFFCVDLEVVVGHGGRIPSRSRTASMLSGRSGSSLAMS